MASENGWEPAKASPDQCEWVTVPGTNPPVSLQLLKGWPLAIMRAVAADFNAFIQPLRDGDSAARTETNSVPTSNHLNATAMDLDWDNHPFHVRGTFNADQMAVVRELLAFYEDTIFWAGDWNDPIDEMHWQMGYDSYNNPHTGDFIARKIRADGFSTFRRGGTVTPAPPPVLSRADRYALLIIAEGQRRNITPRGIEIALATALVESNIQIYANERVPASMSIAHDAVGSDAYSVGIFQQQVRDTGSGWWWGDAATCMDPTTSAGLFYSRLVTHDYNNTANSPGSYAQAVQSSAFPDRYDQRFNDAVAIYNRLSTTAPPPQGEDDLSAQAEQMIADIHRELTQRLPSRSPLRHLDQTAFYPDGLVDTMAGMVLNTDGSEHVQYVSLLAGYGHPPTLALLREVASADPARYPDRQDDAKLAQAILAEATSKPSAPPVAAVAVAPTDNSAALAAAYAENARLREENARLQAAVNTPPVRTVLPAVTVPAMTSGDHAGKVIDSVEDWTQHILAMDTPQRAAFVTSMKALELPNGTQL